MNKANYEECTQESCAINDMKEECISRAKTTPIDLVIEQAEIEKKEVAKAIKADIQAGYERDANQRQQSRNQIMQGILNGLSSGNSGITNNTIQAINNNIRDLQTQSNSGRSNSDGFRSSMSANANNNNQRSVTTQNSYQSNSSAQSSSASRPVQSAQNQNIGTNTNSTGSYNGNPQVANTAKAQSGLTLTQTNGTVQENVGKGTQSVKSCIPARTRQQISRNEIGINASSEELSCQSLKVGLNTRLSKDPESCSNTILVSIDSCTCKPKDLGGIRGMTCILTYTVDSSENWNTPASKTGGTISK